jgi:hypothetical protein
MMESLILLHIGQTAVQVATVDPATLVAAAVAFAVAAIAIWLPHSPLSVHTLRSRRGRRRVASATASALVFFALLPSVVPYDHLFVHDAHAATIDESVHVSHCHVSPGTCSDAPITAGPGQLMLSEPLVLAPAMLAVLIAATATVLVGISFRPETPPPLIPAN